MKSHSAHWALLRPHPSDLETTCILAVHLTMAMATTDGESQLPDPGRLYPVCCAVDIPATVRPLQAFFLNKKLMLTS
jgi:hypothetical protein